MEAVKSVKFDRSKKSPKGSKKFEKTPHSNKTARPAEGEENAAVRKKRKLSFSNVEDDNAALVKLTNGSAGEGSSERPPVKRKRRMEKRERNIMKARELKNTNRELSARARDEKKSKGKMDKVTNTIFVGNLPAAVTKKDIAQVFDVFGKVLSARIRCLVLKPDVKSRKSGAILNQVDRDNVCAYVRYATPEATHLAVKANGVLFDERRIRIDYADPSMKPKTPANQTIFIRNIDLNVTEDELWKTFEQCGEVVSVRIVTDPKNNHLPRGMAYVNFSAPESVQLAVDLGNSGIVLNGRKLEVYAYTAKKRSEGGRPTKRSKGWKDKREKNGSNVPDFAGKIAQPKKGKSEKKFRKQRN